MSARPFPDYMYRVADPTDTRIRDLEAMLLESNDMAAKLSAELLDVMSLFDVSFEGPPE